MERQFSGTTDSIAALCPACPIRTPLRCWRRWGPRAGEWMEMMLDPCGLPLRALPGPRVRAAWEPPTEPHEDSDLQTFLQTNYPQLPEKSSSFMVPYSQMLEPPRKPGRFTLERLDGRIRCVGADRFPWPADPGLTGRESWKRCASERDSRAPAKLRAPGGCPSGTLQGVPTGRKAI
jgi:hypothetical protein